MLNSPFGLGPRILLTGATGLVGRFLLRRLLMGQHEVAVIARTSARGQESSDLARRRIEQVLQPMELDSLWRRPRVIAWNLVDTPDSFPREDLCWLQARPVVVVHCAASIRFQKDDLTGEPYHTNVSGTQHLLEVCKQLPVEGFHHVSTAYVGQHRDSNSVAEVPVTDMNLGGNDYERSKIAAELSVSRRTDIGRITLHRPSIVVGDSQTGFTSTFHGFYTPLQIGWQYARAYGFSDQAGEWFRHRLGLSPEDRKNIVTVDWVAECIARTIEQDSSGQGKGDSTVGPRVLHWTHPEPVSCEEMQLAIVDSIRRAWGSSSRTTVTPLGNSPNATDESHRVDSSTEQNALPSADHFREQMQAYESYFQSDSIFDTEQSQRHSAGIRCPAVDYNLLSRLADWAIKANFGWPKPELPELPYSDVLNALRSFSTSDVSAAEQVVRLQLLGPGSPETLVYGKVESDWRLLPDQVTAHFLWRVALNKLAECLAEESRLTQLLETGCWLIERNPAAKFSNEQGDQHNPSVLAQDWLMCLRAQREAI